MGSFVASASNESDSHQWKKYRSFQAGDGPVLKIWTNTRPYTPVELDPGFAQHRLGPSIALSAKHNDPEGDPATLAFGLWSYPAREPVWAQWSPWVNSGQRVSVTTSSLPDGWYYFAVAAHDGYTVSDFSSLDHLVFIDTVPPNQPTELTPGPGSTVGTSFTASARYSEPYTWPGELMFWVNDEANLNYVTHALSPTVGNGAVGSAQLNLPIGKYNLYVYGHDLGQVTPIPTGPHPITVAAAPSPPANLNVSAAPTAALVKWNDGPSNNSPVTKYDFIAYNSTNPQAAPIQTSCLTACSPTSGFMVDGLIPGNTYAIKATATNAYGTSLQSAASNSVNPQSWSGYAVTATTPARGDTSVRVDWTAQVVTLKYVVKAYTGTRPSDGRAVGEPVSQIDALGGVTTANVGAPNSTPLINGTPHYFTVTPYFLGILAGPESEASNDVTPAGAPFEPENTLMFPGDQQATVLWTPPESQPNGTPGDNGAPITNYNVDVYPEGVAEPVKSLTVTPEQTSADVTGLTNGVSYVAKVSAKNEAKPTPGPPSPPSNISRPAGAPSAPVDIDVARADLGSVQVYWRDPPLGPESTPGDNGARISRYEIVPSPACSACKGLELGGHDNTAIVTGLDPSAAYTFNVRAGNRAGNGPLSVSSAPIVPQLLVPPPDGVPNAPSSVSVTLGVAPRTISDTDKGPAELIAAISWTPAPGPAPTSYTIYALSSGTSETFAGISGSATSFTADGLSGNSSYDFAVVPINDTGVGAGGHSGSVRSLLARMDEYMEMPIPAFQPVWSTRPHHPFMWDSDGCSIGFNLVSEWVNSLNTSCQRHDFGYHNYGHRLGLYMNSQAIRTEVDDNFLRDMRYQCGVNTSSELNRQACLKASKAAYLTIRLPITANTYFRD